MKIVVLIDYTEGSKIAYLQACKLATKFNGIVYALNIVALSDKANEATLKLADFIKTNYTSTNVQPLIGIGNLFEAVPEALTEIQPSLVLICTHGVKGMKQHMFGANILKLVQAIPYPTIVLQANNTVDLSEMKTILFPIGPHENYNIKIQQTAKLAMLLNATIVMYEITKINLETDKIKAENMQNARTYFEENKINYKKIKEDAEVFSAGFSKQTLAFAQNNNVELISLMATISKNELIMKVADKENFVINNLGLPILCCNA